MPRSISEPKESGIFTRSMSSSIAQSVFLREVEVIQAGWRQRARSGRAADPFAEDHDDWMLRRTYRLIRALRSNGHVGVLGAIIASLAAEACDPLKHRGQHSIDDQPFKQALLILYGLNAPSGSPVRSRQWRSELGYALEYAYQHRVHWRHVIGFIKQSGGQKLASKKLAIAGHCEPGFTRRFAANPVEEAA